MILSHINIITTYVAAQLDLPESREAISNLTRQPFKLPPVEWHMAVPAQSGAQTVLDATFTVGRYNFHLVIKVNNVGRQYLGDWVVNRMPSVVNNYGPDVEGYNAMWVLSTEDDDRQFKKLGPVQPDNHAAPTFLMSPDNLFGKAREGVSLVPRAIANLFEDDNVVAKGQLPYSIDAMRPQPRKPRKQAKAA